MMIADDVTTSGDLFDLSGQSKNAHYRDGSAKIALDLSHPFDRYLFVEKSKRRIDVLKKMIQVAHSDLKTRCVLRHGDANDALRTWCKERDWMSERAVVFLDPFGMQVEWSTIETLAGTKGVDLWYLFPLGVGVMRLLKRSGPIDKKWRHRLDLIFGTDGWLSHFYPTRTTEDLFGKRELTVRDVTVERVRQFVNSRLSTCFVAVADGLILKNSKGNPLYLLCFAASNEKGAPTALKIAGNILGRKGPKEDK